MGHLAEYKIRLTDVAVLTRQNHRSTASYRLEKTFKNMKSNRKEVGINELVRHGLLFDPIKFILVFMKHPCKWSAIYLIATSLLLALPAVFIERYSKRVCGAESIGLVLQPLNSFTVTFPAVMVCRVKAITAVGGLLTLFVYLIITLKLFYYYQVNQWHREGTEHSSHRSRKNERGQSEQIMYPVNLKDIEFALLMEYILKLAVANHFIWLIFFNWFHSCLNCLAELLQFGDWQFHLDWNADSLLQLWSRWNTPAHRWLDRHIYKLLLHHGYDKWQARPAAFLLLACFCKRQDCKGLVSGRSALWQCNSCCVTKSILHFCHKNQPSIQHHLFVSPSGRHLLILWRLCLTSRATGEMTATVTCSCGISLVLGPPLMVLVYFQDYYMIHC
ncbi:LOW QUALITY PROTEIN: diacylglycerol O-acyltransferase 1 [Ciconia maguari]